jgi:hypothetical protein
LLIDPIGEIRAGARKSDHLPCAHSAIAAIQGIREISFPHVVARIGPIRRELSPENTRRRRATDKG